MADKIVNQLPVVLQTTAIKNFFENTVEQLYSQANTTPLKGFIGKQTGEDAALLGGFIAENTPDRREYNLTPAVNNINSITGESENLLFYDELVDILETRGVTTRNHNTIFGSTYRVFMPPIDIDKFVNYQEYYWSLSGPSTITITATLQSPINIEIDVLGKSSFTHSGTTLRNGMIIKFVDNGYTIPANCVSNATYKADVEYIVGGVGESIYLVEKDLTNNTSYGGSEQDTKDYIIIERGSYNNTAWSRVNHWYHRNNFKDAGDDLPAREYRANRPIIEFDRHVELYDSGTSTYGVATVNAGGHTITEIEGLATFTVDAHTLVNDDIVYFPNESASNRQYLYKVSGVGSAIVLTATSTTPIATGGSVSVSSGNTFKGLDYFYNGTSYQEAQRKIGENQPPLFVLYDDTRNRLDNTGLYYKSTFTGSKIFGYKIGNGQNDTELGFPLSYTPYKSVSEITFENFIQSERVSYETFGSSTLNSVLGSYYYKLAKPTPEYHSYWKNSPERNEQKIITTHYITQIEVDDNKLVYNIGATPNVNSATPSGYDIMVKVNGALVSDYIYQSPNSIKFSSFTFSSGDIIDIEVESKEGIVQINDSRYSIPLSWKANPHNQEIELVAEPDYLSHFKRYIERQQNFSGDSLGSNNFSSTDKNVVHAKDIVQTNHDLILSAFLLDDQPHNLVDAIRFSGREYEKYKARLIKEISNYYASFDTENLTNEYILERVLRNIISYSVGKGVFDSTYILPFGDNYKEQLFDVASTTTKVYTLDNYDDISLIENSLLVYRRPIGSVSVELLTLDSDYTFTSTNPITITVSSDLDLGDTIITKLYNKDRDSVACPATPSTMGLYPLFVPRIETDNSYQTPIQVLVGHDGSKTTLKGDLRDTILLEFEKRIYNSARKELRDANSLPALNVFDVRSGAFRDTNFAPREYADLLRNGFINWTNANKVDFVINEFFDQTDQWTWNYRGEQDVPGHWRGWYEYYYDTVRPHTHPWEMLAFFEKPSWWDTQYGTDYGSNNLSMWEDLEEGIIRQGPRENVTDNKYLTENPLRRQGLSDVLPVDSSANLLAPGLITSTGSAVKTETWSNIRVSRTDVTDTIKDTTNTLGSNLPNGIQATYGAATALRVLFDANAAPQAGTYWDYNGTLSGNISGSGFVEGFDGFITPYIFVSNDNLLKKYQLYNYTFDNLADPTIVVTKLTDLSDTTIGLSVTGVPTLNTANVNSWNNEGVWFYNNAYRNEPHEFGVYTYTPSSVGLTEWDDSTHSPIVGWSFDGLPIYGAYGYAEYHANGHVADSTLTNIKSCFKLKPGDRPTGPCGKYSGEFVQDYQYDPAVDGTNGYTGTPSAGLLGRYNMRYGVTPDSPTTPIFFYVATHNDDLSPMFPYTLGGTASGADNTYKGQFYAEPVNISQNNVGNVTASGQLVAITSELIVTSTLVSSPAGDIDYIGRAWRFGDSAPVENAWKYSSGYPFAVAEALLLAKPGKFTTVFGDPTHITSPELDSAKIINSTDRTPYDFRNPTHQRIHGDIDSNNNSIINVGYTQFIHSWLQYQKLNTKTDFADKLRTVNIKLAHRVAGFTDKDTLTVRTDQISTTNKTTSLIIPQENFGVVVHSSPYKNRNFYSGLIVQKTAGGYKIRGFDKNFGYFNVLRRNFAGKTSLAEVGGQPVSFDTWEPAKSYIKDTIVSYQNAYYKAPSLVPSSETFIASLWTRLPSLPTTGSQRATLYLENLPYVDRYDYETEFSTVQKLVDFVVGLGEYQKSIGYDFGIYDNTINETRDWTYAVRQLLFWVAGGWETNNTLELSPLANKIKFVSNTGMIAKINRVDQSQFSLVDQNGKAIQPSECEIIREGTTIELVPPAGQQIYGCMLFTKEVEHALVFDNVTNFNDTLFSPLLSQTQTRLRVKGKKTANWEGIFDSEGFIIQDDELKPNLDNMAQSLGRYHELGFVPVEKQLYDQARGLYGYQERDFLRELDIEDDDQFEFYKGMLQSKGTIPSMQKIAKSNAIIQGNMDVYDEWALKISDFGDLENDQAIELKLEKSDITHDPQLITLAYPEDTTGVIDQIKIISTEHLYYDVPTLEIDAPSRTPAVQAYASAYLSDAGTLGGFTITNAGSGYQEPPRIKVVAGNVFISNVSSTFNLPVATTYDYTARPNIANLNLTYISITDNSGGANVTANIDISNITSFANIVTLINSDATINANITASYAEMTVVIGENLPSEQLVAWDRNAPPLEGTYWDYDGTVSASVAGSGYEEGFDREQTRLAITQYALSISGNDFTLNESGNTLANISMLPGRYQPIQRYAVASVGNHPTKGTGATTVDDIKVYVNGAEVESSSGNVTNWTYDAGSRQCFAATANVTTGSELYSISPIDANNIVTANGYDYTYISVLIDGQELVNGPVDQSFTMTTTDVTIDVDKTPTGKIDAGANICVIEKPTIQFTPSYFDDLPGANLNIKTTTSDEIAIITKSQRIYTITEDDKNDDAIFIDIDDTTRFLKKPIGVRETNLWPTTSNVSYQGVTDDKYLRIPNAGYVNSNNVDFRSFDVPSIAEMFSADIAFHPEANHTVHVAISENKDWNVYEFKEIQSNVSFVEQETTDLTAYLYTDTSLFDYTDSNQIGNVDLGRYLDYHIVLKDADVNEKFVVWVNEEVVDSQQVRISNISGVQMTEVSVASIGPAETPLEIANIGYALSAFSIGEATANVDGAGNVEITADVYTLENGDVVGFASAAGNAVSLHANTFVAANVDIANGTFRVNDPALTSDVDSGNLVVRYFGKTKITTASNHSLNSGEMIKVVAGSYSGAYLVENSGSNTFVIDTPYISTGPTTGNVLTASIVITTETDHGINTAYSGKRIAVSNADPRYYNQVYTVASTTANTITVNQTFAYADVANVMSNTVITTIDHDTINLNSTKFKLDNINSVDGIVDSINRGMTLRRGWVERAGSFSMSIPMQNNGIDPRTGLMSSQTSGAIPFVSADSGISFNNLKQTGSLTIDPSITQKIGFNKDIIKAAASAAPRTITNVTSGSPGTTLNTSPFSQAFAGTGGAQRVSYSAIGNAGNYYNHSGMEDYTEGYVQVDMLGQTRLIDPSPAPLASPVAPAPKKINIPLVSTTPTTVDVPPRTSRSVNNPKPVRNNKTAPNSTGAVVINPVAVVAVPKQKVCGTSLPPVTPPPVPPVPKAVTPTPVKPAPATPKVVPANTTMKCEYQEQGSSSVGTSDKWYYLIPVAGKVKMIVDAYSAEDEFKCYQTSTRDSSNTSIQVGGSNKTLRIATQSEKVALSSGKFGAASFTGSTTYKGRPQDYEKVGSAFKYCAVIEFDWDPNNGSYLRVDVAKGATSSVYRYYICYPSTAGTVQPKQNTNPGQPAFLPPYAGPGFPNIVDYASKSIAQTPIIKPSHRPTTRKKVYTPDRKDPGVNSSAGTWRYGSGSSNGYAHNFGGFSLAPMAGYGFIPSIFKKTVKVTSAENNGRLQPLDASRYVNSSVQRVTGGDIIPLAAPVAPPIPYSVPSIRGLNFSSDPLFKSLGDVANGKDVYIDYQPKRIASANYNTQSLALPASLGSTGTAGAIGVAGTTTSGRTVVPYNNLVGSTPATVIGTFSADNTIAGTPPRIGNTDFQNTGLIPAAELDSQDAPVDVDNFEFNEAPVITITPKVKVVNADGTYTFEPAGPTALVPIWSPTPSQTISTNDLIGATPGDELLINNKSITIQDKPEATLKQIECAVGFGFTTSKTVKKGDPALKISSCTNAPVSFKDGCRGGTFKEVLDFHIVKTFSLTDSETSNTAVLTSTGGWSRYNSGTGIYENYTPDSTYTLYNAAGGTTGTQSLTSGDSSNTGKVLSSKTELEHTGGKGYSVGDRLRVVGGVPYASPYGEVREICIKDAGNYYGYDPVTGKYDNAGNVKVLIGDGSTPGKGATVASVELNSSTGAITNVIMSNTGRGYDIGNPPKIRVVDIGEVYAPQMVIPAMLTATIQTKSTTNTGVEKNTHGLPERPAKFIVTKVDSEGRIEALRILDRGIYKEFPADLSTGLPLEYDAINLGDEHDGSIPPTNATGLGQYDPVTYEKLPSPGNYDPIRSKFTNFGTGARIFLTAREIPDCSERGNARAAINLGADTPDIDIPSHLADLLNNGLLAAGYNPDDINFGISPLNDDLSSLVLDSPAFDGVEFGELTPGFLDKLGIPAGDYNPDMTELAAVNATPLNDSNNTGDLPEESISIYGVYDNGLGTDPTSIFGDANVTYINELYQYELRTVDGGPVISTKDSKNVQVLYLESLRHSTEAGLDLANISNVWIDNYNGTGWAHLESGNVKRQQTALVDPKYIRNTIIYDSTTGKKDYDYNMWDPFKGVLPASVDAEIDYISEADPVAYSNINPSSVGLNFRSGFGKDNVGQVWWDTSSIRYNWYEQGTNRERWQNWGSAFPGSSISVYEWVESKNLPLDYQGTGTPKNGSEYIVERRRDKSTGDYTNYYYYWVQNVEEVSNQAAVNSGRKFSTQQVARYLADPIGQGLNTVSFISAGDDESTNVASFVMGNLSKTIREDEQNIQINLSRNLNPMGVKHTAWKLLRENDNNSDIPEDLIAKMIDSLCEEDAAGNSVPASNLSEAERYGIKFRPRQTMFKNPAQARRAFVYLTNKILEDIKVKTLYPNWQQLMPTLATKYIETVNWYEKIRKDLTTNNDVRYDATYKAAFTVSSVNELNTLGGIADGTVVMVRANITDRYQLWRWSGSAEKFQLISIENETVRIKPTVFTDTINSTLKSELRSFITILESTIFQNTAHFNRLFFEMLKYALGEQQELDWAFKTTYIYVEKQEEDLVQRVGYNPDNFDPVIEYLNEVKPYNAKIREYKDGKKAPLEYINDQSISDFDVPPYADATRGEIRTLNFDSSSDRDIMAKDVDYVKAYSGYSQSQTEWDTANVPVRVNNVSLIFDRIDWRLLEHDFNAATTTYTVSIANNIADINSASNTTVANTASNVYSASSRIFKFDPEVRTQFATDIDEYYGANSSSNTSITQSNSYIQTAVAAGALNRTLYMIKQKVGGNWNGEELDANVFTQVVNYADSLTLQSVFGYDTSPWDSDSGFGSQFDSSITVENYEGLFAGNTTFRQDGITYDGFDGWSFKHLLYGEERPEELVYLSPLENFVMHVRTDKTAYDANGSVVDTISIGPYQIDAVSNSSVSNVVTITSSLAVPLLEDSDTVRLTDEGNTILANDFVISNVDTANSTFTIQLAGVDSNIIASAGNITVFSGVTAVATEYIVHNDLFGNSEYLRILTDGSTSTTTTKNINSWDTEIEVADASVLPAPRPGFPGAVWINHSERIEYKRISGNKLLDISRGTRGTTIPNGPVYTYNGNVATLSNTFISHESNVSVVAAGNDNVFNAKPSNGGTSGWETRNPEDVSWLNANGTSLSLSDKTNRSVTNTIAKFLHGDT